MPSPQTLSPNTLRVDKWLWATRFFKTRGLASKACDGGKIKRQGKSIKPSAILKVGDCLTVPAHEATYQRSITVTALIEIRVSPALAREAYTEHTKESLIIEARENAKNDRAQRQEGDQGKLTKKRRRNWEKQKNGFFK